LSKEYAMNMNELINERLYWDDLVVGDVYESASRTITEADVVNFACLSGDFNRLHVDSGYASKTPYGQRVAHGLLVVSVLSGLCTRMLLNVFLEPSIIGALSMELRLPKPTFIGDTIHVRVEIADKRETSKPGRGVATFNRQAINQRGEIVVDGVFKVLISRKT
jgi:acyl dehydratase